MGAEGALEGNSTVTEKSITQKIVHGMTWLFALKLSTRGIGFASTLVLARILSPADFGVLGIAMLSISLLQTFSETGFEGALIQKNGDIAGFLNSAWVIAVVRGACLTALLFFGAPMVASFFGSPMAGPILKALAFVPLLNGLSNIGLVFFKKDLDFKKLFIFELCGQMIYVLVAVPLAFIHRNVWALALGTLASNLASLLVSYGIHSYRPAFRIDWKIAKELFNFGKWLLGTHILLYLINQGDNLFVGKILGPAALGFYAMAYKISFLPVTELTFVTSKVMFPAYSRLQGNREKLREAYVGMLTVLSYVSIPLSGLVFLFAEDFVRIVLGAKWLSIFPIIQVFAFSAMLRSVSSTTGALFQGIGRPDIVAKLVAMRLVIIALLIYPLTLIWGLVGTALAILASNAVIDPLALTLGGRMIGCDMKSFWTALLCPLGNTLLCLAISVGVKAAFHQVHPLWRLVGISLIFASFYLATSYFLTHFFEYQPLALFKKIRIQGKAAPLSA